MLNDTIEKFDKEYPETDLYCYFGPIVRPSDDNVIREMRERKKKKNPCLSG